jgi:mannose-1-phosphate guanylyltransferase
MPSANRYVVIMAGGKGERFWPMSRQKMPKQFLPIVGNSPLLRQTVDRVLPMVGAERIIVITGRGQSGTVGGICPMLPKDNIIAEPEGRNTAAAVALAALLVRIRDANASMAVLPSDHVIHDEEHFRLVLKGAFEVAECEDSLVTIGIEPTFPATGYGYIGRGAECMRVGDLPVHKVERFVEKPDLETAKQYVNSGQFLWNAGMFIWRAKTICAALQKHVPDIWGGLKDLEVALGGGIPIDEALGEIYPRIRKISIDYALIEKADNVLTLPGIFDWDDVGAWTALVRHMSTDRSGNALRGDAVVLDGANNIVVGDKGRLVALMGLSNCIVVNTGDVTMICPCDRAQDIRNLVREVALNPDWADKV